MMRFPAVPERFPTISSGSRPVPKTGSHPVLSGSHLLEVLGTAVPGTGSDPCALPYRGSARWEPGTGREAGNRVWEPRLVPSGSYERSDASGNSRRGDLTLQYLTEAAYGV
jgi:hypothetical protein